MDSRVCRPCFRAFLLPGGAPDPKAPPCIRHRLFPLTAGDMQALPDLVLAPQRGLDNIKRVLREWLLVIVFSGGEAVLRGPVHQGLALPNAADPYLLVDQPLGCLLLLVG
jgi:hypothetical protein